MCLPIPISLSCDVHSNQLHHDFIDYLIMISKISFNYKMNPIHIMIMIIAYIFCRKYYGIPLIATNLRAKSMLGKGQIYLPRDGFKRAYTWAEGVVNERVLEAENQQKKIEQLMLNLLFHPQLKQYIR